MNNVLTKEDARKVLKGRTPLVPVEYETAIRALTECASLDEAKYWDNKADALAAWAKIYHSDEAARKSKALKLHAYRRMGQLAKELRPGGRGGAAGSKPGPLSLLMENGLAHKEASAANKLASLTEKQFERVTRHPLAPTTVMLRLVDIEPVWRDFVRVVQVLRAFSRNNTPSAVIRAIETKRYPLAREMVLEVTEWLDELEQRLPKEK